VDEIFGDPHLSGHYVCSVDGPQSPEFMTSQSIDTKRYVPIHMPAWRTSVSQSQAKQMPIIVHRDHQLPAYRMPRLPAVNSIIS